MFLHCVAGDLHVVEIHDDELVQVGLQESFMSCWKVAGALVSPKGMTRYS